MLSLERASHAFGFWPPRPERVNLSAAASSVSKPRSCVVPTRVLLKVIIIGAVVGTVFGVVGHYLGVPGAVAGGAAGAIVAVAAGALWRRDSGRARG